jgi:tetratricopeptide (TPR) repeat protein
MPSPVTATRSRPRGNSATVRARCRPGAAGGAADLRKLGDQQGRANALSYLGTVRQRTGNYPAAATAHHQALAIYQRIGNRLGKANALSDLGTVQRLAGSYASAAEYYQQALAIFRHLGDRLGRGVSTYELAILRRLTGDYASAELALTEALNCSAISATAPPRPEHSTKPGRST